MKNLNKFLRNIKGAKDVSGAIMGLVLGAILMFNLFTSWYSAWISSNETLHTGCPPHYNTSSPCPASHRALLPVTVILIFVGFILIVYSAVRKR